MKTPTVRRRNFFSFSSYGIRIAAFVLTATVLAFSSFSARSGAPTETGASAEAAQSASITNSTVSSRFSNAVFLPQAGTPAVATFDATCATADSDFNIGQTVCGHATSTGGSASGRRITWVDPQGFVRQSTPVTDDTQDDTFVIPSDPTSTLSNGQEVSNIGKWRVNIVNRRGSLVTYAVFLVKDPANGRADLAIFKRAPGSAERLSPGSISTFQVFIENYGPDDAQNVVVTDRVPDNTTFVAMIQTSLTPNPGFTCDTVPDANGDVKCTISSLASGETASFDVAFTIDNGAVPGTLITNTATISSATTDGTALDNTSSATITVAGGDGGAGTCTLNCPPNVNTQADTTDANDNPGAIVHFDQPTSEGTCGTITADHCNDCFFPVGTTVVTFSSTTGDSCSFAVTVSPPNTGGATTISCPGNKSGTADGSCNTVFDLGTATATGTNVTLVAFRSDGKPVYTCDEFGNCTRNSSDPGFSVGTSTVTWFAYSHDIAGPYDAQTGDEESRRTGTASCTQTVFVQDVTPPTIAATDQTVAADASCQVAVPDYSSTVSDNCACSASDESEACQDHGDIVYTQNPTAGTMVGLGPHTIHIEASDGTNTATKDITLTVTDQTAPAINCPANVVTTTDSGSCTATVDPGTATASDNCDTSPTIVGTRSDSQPLNAPYPKGTTTITWRATDDAGNYSECNQTVTVNDEEPPTISCPADITVYLAPNSTDTTAVVNYTAPVGQDNCAGATTTQEAGLASGSAFPVGTTTNTFRVTDASGNYTECSFTVTVLYNFTGFFSPINNPPTFNNVNAGRAIPIKFSLSGDKGLNIFAAGYPVSQQIACDSSAPLSDVEGTVTNGGSTLTYSPDQYHYSWKTESSWAGTCRKLIVKLNDGTEHTALFKFK